MTRILPLIALCLALLVQALPAPAQQGGLFAPRVSINGKVVTNFEVEQRLRMLTLFGTQGDVEAEAMQGLIDDRLRMFAAAQIGLQVTPEALEAGMTEFAGRANLPLEEFLAALQQGGVEPEALRDFVEAGLLWREVVRARFVGRIAITETEVDRALAADTRRAAVRLLLSELVLTAAPGNESQARALANRLRREIRTEEDFAAAAREYSSAGTAGSGGRLDWRLLTALPPEAAAALSNLGPGRISEPVTQPGTVTIYFVRDLQQGNPTEAAIAVDYARFALPPGDPATEAARLRAKVDTCDDLYALALGNPPEQLVRETQNVSQLSGDLAGELARLDDGEGTLIVRGGVAQYLMLCRRAPVEDGSLSRDGVREVLLNRRLGALADGYLESLRSDAIIREY
ncbi:MAG: peptidylprolyl isomerase [Gemmobacter sp.]